MMSGPHSTELVIENLLGFHVRPIQRFAEVAQAFVCDIQVRIEDLEVPGRSIMSLMKLKGKHGSTMKIAAKGEDARQALAVLEFVVQSKFFVEDEPHTELDPRRHIRRLATIASCFDSCVSAELDSRTADAKSVAELSTLGLTPYSRPLLHISGKDCEQARRVLDKLVEHCFYVEEAMAGSPPAQRE